MKIWVRSHISDEQQVNPALPPDKFSRAITRQGNYIRDAGNIFSKRVKRQVLPRLLFERQDPRLPHPRIKTVRGHAQGRVLSEDPGRLPEQRTDFHDAAVWRNPACKAGQPVELRRIHMAGDRKVQLNIRVVLSALLFVTCRASRYPLINAALADVPVTDDGTSNRASPRRCVGVRSSDPRPSR